MTPGAITRSKTSMPAGLSSASSFSRRRISTGLPRCAATTTRFMSTRPMLHAPGSAATVSHGMLLFAAVREFVACVFADSGLQAQTLKFPTPAYAEEPLRIELVGQGDAGDGVLALATRVVKLDGQLCLDGMCRVLTANGNGS